MNPLKIMTVFGTRPEAIKMAPLIQELQKRPQFNCLVCVTAQHREMLDQALDIFRIRPDFDLNIMKRSQTLAHITVEALTGLQKIIGEERPDLVLVHGDTTTTFAGALAAYYEKTKLGHVEAGLRSYDKLQPYPEEMNRKLTTVLADLHFAPTTLAKEQLLAEGVDAQRIFVTGNTVIDCLRTTVSKDYRFKEAALRDIDYQNKRIIVMTAHRRENLGKPLEDICRAVGRLVEDFPETEVVYAVHSNPAVQNTARGILGGKKGVHLTPPLDMEDMHNLIRRSYLVLTDSGGLQEEAPSFGKPVLVLRERTERPEGILAGAVKLVGTSEESVYGTCARLLTDSCAYEEMARTRNPFGDGFAAPRIADAILYHFGLQKEKPEEFK